MSALPHELCEPLAASRHLAANDAPADRLGALLNLAGRQRMLSQRIVLFGVLAAQGDGQALATAQEALALFRGSHHRLLSSRLLQPDEVAQVLHPAFFGPEGIDLPARQFVRLAEDTLATIAAGQPGMHRRMSSLVARATPMLALLDRLVQCYEELVQQQEQACRRREAALSQQVELLAQFARNAATAPPSAVPGSASR